MSADVPVAIVGIGCKFPGGADTKEQYYEFLRGKGNGMVKPPPDRWDYLEWQGGDDEPGKYNSAMSGFINDIDMFDSLEFGISKKEAEYMDPSLRVTLEVAHQALMDSGTNYRGSDTGVYFAQLLTSTGELIDDRYDVNGYHGLGKCIAIRANRVSFTFDLRGPSLTVDTACSSAATAMHIALSAIKLGDISQALIIGGNTIIHPQHMVAFSKLGVLSPTGSSKPFDAAADGYARAEGFAAVLVKRLDKAIAEGDYIYSIITGSSINSNGKGTSLTMPEGAMQVETITQAYLRANRKPSEAFYVELHATGTSVGDPIEVNAAGKIFAEGRQGKKPLKIGSVKSNIGHTEGCSFLASLIKVSLMLKQKEILPNINYVTPNPRINFEKLLLDVQTEVEPLTADFAAPDGKWVASVSCHGIGGSNSHVVIESFESTLVSTPTQTRTTSFKPMYLFIFAANTEPTVSRWRDSLVAAYSDTSDNRLLRSLSHDLARLSRTFSVQAFAIGSTISAGLELSKPVMINPKANPKLCLVFAGQGPQHILMGRTLFSAFAAFSDSIVRSDNILVEKFGKESFLKQSGLFVPGEEATLPEDGVWAVQDTIYSIVFVQLALVDLLQSLGIKYDYVVGHSLGEVAMGYASGHYNRETAIGLAIARAQAMKHAEGNGGMVALGVGMQKAKSMIKEILRDAKVADGLWISAMNAPHAVTVSGKQELIDALVTLAEGLDNVSATKLRVTCAFHTPLMEPFEETFKTAVNGIFSCDTNPPLTRVMSTVDGTWLDRNFDTDYCWDNICRPVLFGNAIHKIVKEHDDGGVLFMEIAPHPVLKAYIEQCGGKPINLIRRPNPKHPAQNSGEHHQFLQGIGHLLTAGYKTVDLAKMCADPDGTQDFIKCQLPKYPLNRSPCWAESELTRSIRLRQKPRPLASPQFRLNVHTHPDLAGHIIFDASVFPASGYIESVLENGAMVVKDIRFHRPLVLDRHGTSPAHVGCIAHDDKWEFRAATTSSFDNGNIRLDTEYASGGFLPQNIRFDPSNPKRLDVDSMLSLARRSITGKEFYGALPSAYGYKDIFSNYIQEVYEVPDQDSWFGLGYLAKLEIDAHSFLDQGYVIHPSILDSVIHSALVMFINMETKSADFSGIFLPSKVDTISRWDSGTFVDFDPGLQGIVWSYFTVRNFAPEGPLTFDYIVANSEKQVLLTIEGFETMVAPHGAVSDISMAERLTIVWQPKKFPSSDFPLRSTSPDALSCLRDTFEGLISNAQTAGRHVVRVLDLDQNLEIAKALDASLVSFLSKGLFVEYFFEVASAQNTDGKAWSLEHSHVRPFVLDESDDRAFLSSFDILLEPVDLSHVPSDLGKRLEYLVPSGVIFFVVSTPTSSDSETTTKGDSVDQRCHLADLVQQLQALPGVEVSVADFNAKDALILLRSTAACGRVEELPSDDVVIHHFKHGNEGQLVEIVKSLSVGSELWIVGNDDAAGFGAVGITACMAAESPDFTVRTLIFENHDISPEAKAVVIHSLRQNPLLLEQHLKWSCDGEIFVRRLVYSSPEVKAVTPPGIMASTSKSQVVPYFPRNIRPTEAEVSVNALGIDNLSEDKSLFVFVGKITHLGADVTTVSLDTNVVGIVNSAITDVVIVDQNSFVALPNHFIDLNDAAALPTTFLAAWCALLEKAGIMDKSTVLIHDAGSRIGLGAVQLCQRFGANFFCTVATVADAVELTTWLNVDDQSITVLLPGENFRSTVQTWLAMNSCVGFDIIFNPQGSSEFATGIDFLKPMGQYIHNQKSPLDPVDLPSGAPTTHVIKLSKLVEYHPAKVASILSGLLTEHTSLPFRLPLHPVSFSQLASSEKLTTSPFSLPVVVPERPMSIDTNPTGQLFDPRKIYLLLGGSSELGIRITSWMVSHGALRFILTSRRGSEALTKMDLMYLHHLKLSNVEVEVVASDARNHQEMAAIIDRANKIAPIGGIFLMAVVLRDAAFSRLTQESFDDVYLSKVHILNTLLSCVSPADLEFLLLFSTIGTVFGNAGQAAYCASQSYLDRIAETLPNTVSISLPAITDAGVFKRLIQSMKGQAQVEQLAKAGISTAQACNFIGDSLSRRVSHYVPMAAITKIPRFFPNCEPLLYSHLLPKRPLKGAEGDTESLTPTTLLCAIVGLRPEQIDENTAVTSYGIDSLGAVRFSIELKKHLNIKISQIELLGSTTIVMLNEKLREVGKASIQAGEEDDTAAVKYGAPLTAILDEQLAYGETYTTDATSHQYRLWHAQADLDNAGVRAPNQHERTVWGTHKGLFIVITFSNPFDIDCMRCAMNEIVQRHGALRTTFSLSEEGKLRQTIHPSLGFETEVVDLSSQADARGKAYEISLAAHRNPNFLLDRSALLMLTLFDLGKGEWGFNLIFHHIIMDERSLATFFYELFTLYFRGFDSIPPPRLHYSDFSDWLLRTTDSHNWLRNNHLEFWAESLKDVQTLQLTLVTPSSELLSPVSHIETKIDPRTLERYHALLREAKVMPFAGFFAVYNLLLFKYSSQASFVVGTPVPQPNLPELAKVVGFFTNILPIKTTIDVDQTFSQYLTAFNADLMKSLENGDVAYEEILSQHEDRSPDRSPFNGYFAHVFAFGGMNLDALEEVVLDAAEELTSEDIQVQSITPLPNVGHQYEVNLTVRDETGHLALQFDNHLLSEESARLLLNGYSILIRNLGCDPHIKICDISATTRQYDCLGIQMSYAGEGVETKVFLKSVTPEVTKHKAINTNGNLMSVV